MRTVRGRITLWACLLLSCSVAVVAFLNIYYMTNRISAKEEEILRTQTYYSAEEINTQFMMEINLLKGFKSAIEAMDEPNAENIKKLIDKYYDGNPELLNIYYGDIGGNFVKADNGGEVFEGYDPRKRTWYQDAVKLDEIVVTNPYMAASKVAMCASISVPVYRNNKIIGVAGLDISLETIIALVNSISYEEGAYGFLLDSDNCIVTHPVEDYLPNAENKTNVFEVYPEMKINLEDAHKDVFEMENYDGASYFFSSSYVNGCGWRLVVATPTAIAESDTIASARMSFLVALVSLLAAIIVCLILVKREFKPINAIIPEVEKVSKGNFNVDLQVDFNSMEFVKLQSSIQRMVDTLNGIISETNTVLGEISNGNLSVDDMSEYEGEFNEISRSVNSIKATLNALISDIQFSAINLQSTAMGFTGCANAEPEELNAIFMELSAEANDLMEKANRFKTVFK